MNLPVLLEPVAGNGYRATGASPFPFSVEGATREEALHRFQQALEGRLSAGAEIVSVPLPEAEHPLARFAGMFQNHPLFDEWQQAIMEYRQQANTASEAE